MENNWESEREPRQTDGGCGHLLVFRKADAATGAPLPGAVFRLTRGGRPVGTSVSDDEGTVYFPALPPGRYRLWELTPPPGYEPQPAVYTVDVHRCGCVFIDGEPMNRFVAYNRKTGYGLDFVKVDAFQGGGVPGASFALLREGRIVARAASNCRGLVRFRGIGPGGYTLVETAPPEGFLPDSSGHSVRLDETGGVTVDGREGPDFFLLNIPAYALRAYLYTGDFQPLPGAVFSLSRDGRILRTAVSDADGFANFRDLAPGVYTLAESQPPAGYAPDPQPRQIAVRFDGRVAIDGAEVSELSVANTPLPQS